MDYTLLAALFGGQPYGYGQQSLGFQPLNYAAAGTPQGYGMSNLAPKTPDALQAFQIANYYRLMNGGRSAKRWAAEECGPVGLCFAYSPSQRDRSNGRLQPQPTCRRGFDRRREFFRHICDNLLGVKLAGGRRCFRNSLFLTNRQQQ
jgi:hypothetical protein